MKRKIFIIFLALVCAFACVFAVTACKNKDAGTDNQTDGGEEPDVEEEDVPEQGGNIEEEPDFGDEGDGLPTEGLEYSEIIKNNEVIAYSVRGKGTAEEAVIVIPAEYNEKPVISIGETAFRNCESLTGITIPDSVESIGERAFEGCSSLIRINYTGDIEGWCAFSDLSGLMSYGSENKRLYIDGEELAGNIVIPEGVTAIGSYAFCGCGRLRVVTIPNSIESIDKGVFEGCGGLVYYEYDNACYLGNTENPYLVLVKAKDTSITRCTVNDSTRFIHSSAFYDCISLTDAVIGNSVTVIGNSAFWNCCYMTSVTIPNSVTFIDEYAFYWCRAMSDIHFKGTAEEWDGLAKGIWWNSYTGRYTVHCTDGDISK